MASRQRGRETVSDMVRSMGAVLAVVAFVAIVVQVSRNEPERPAVDWQSVVTQGTSAAPDLVVPPADLPWPATSASWDDATRVLRIGFLVDDNSFVGLTSTADAGAGFAEDQLDAFEATGTRDIDGQTWVAYAERDGSDPDVALESTEGQSSVILIGTDTLDDLVPVAQRLR